MKTPQSRLSSGGLNFHTHVGWGEMYRPQVFAAYALSPEGIYTVYIICWQIFSGRSYVRLAIFLSPGILSWIEAHCVVAVGKDSAQVRKVELKGARGGA